MRVLHYMELDKKVKPAGIQVATDNQRKAMRLAGIETVTRLEHCDVVHLCTIGPKAYLLAKRARRREIPLVMSTHITAEDFRGTFALSTRATGLLKAYLKRFYGMADVLVAPSQYTADLLRSYGIRTRTEVVSNGIDLSAFVSLEKRRRAYRKRFGLSGVTVYMVGNVFLKKGLQTFIDVARSVDAQFIWFGRTYRGVNASRVARLLGGAPANARFSGWVEDNVASHAAGDVFLFPTHDENQGIVLLESAACAKPSVIRDLPVFNGWEGSTKATSTEEFVERVRELVESAPERRRLSRKAFHEARQHSLEKVGRRLKSVYESLC